MWKNIPLVMWSLITTPGERRASFVVLNTKWATKIGKQINKQTLKKIISWRSSHFIHILHYGGNMRANDETSWVSMTQRCPGDE